MGAPLWLLGLALLPLIRWLHRGGRHRRRLPVAYLGLWRGAEVQAAAAGRPQPPDPAWRRRALACALLCLALAEPRLPLTQQRVTLWVDDSLHMRVREADGTRLALGLAEARSRLAAAPPADLQVRVLGDPWRALPALDDATVAALAGAAGRRDPAPPPAALLDSGRENWLVTDGADPALLAWPGGRAPDVLVRVGRVTRNVGLERLAARRDPQDPAALALLLKVVNVGAEAETRSLEFVTAQGPTAAQPIRLEPGAALRVPASVPAGARVRARLLPRDALAEDDEIELDLAPLARRRVAAGPGCAPALLAALRAHPALTLLAAPAEEAQAFVDCGSGAPAGLPTLRVTAPRTPALAVGPLRWSDAVAEPRRLALDDGSVWTTGSPLQPSATDRVLLAAGDTPLLLRRGAPAALLETAVDFEATARHAATAVPLLANLMLEALFDAPLLDAFAVVERSPAALRVAPAASAAASAAPAPRRAAAAPAGRDATPLLAVLAAIVLAWEIVALARQWRRLAA